MWRRRQPKADPEGKAATAARQAKRLTTEDLHEWAEQCVAALDARVLGLRHSEAILRGEANEAMEINAILGAVLAELTARYV